MAQIPYDYEHIFNISVYKLIDALNEYRKENDRPPVTANMFLNSNAIERAGHLIDHGMDDGTTLVETVRPFYRQDMTGVVELVRQWPTYKKDPSDYLFPWTRDQEARSLLLGDFGYGGYGGKIVKVSPTKLRAVVVLVLSPHQPRPPK